MRWLRVERATLARLAPLLVSVGLVFAVGGIGLSASANANRKAQDIHRDDRIFLEEQLASLSDQFMKLAAKEVLDYAADQPWSLTPGDAADQARLRALTERSALFHHGAAIASLTGEPLNAFANEPGLPPQDDPGFDPLIGALLRGEPGLTSVMLVDGVPVVGVGVPVLASGAPTAIIVAFFRADAGPLQTYNERLIVGETGVGYMIDSAGTVLASRDPAAVGARLPATPVLDALRSGDERFVEYERDGQRLVAAFAPIGIGGWAVVTEQSADEFFGPIRSGGFRTMLALVGLLVVAASALMVLNHKRKEALERAYEYKGKLLANTTHELKTPLTAIRGAALTLGMRWRDMKAEQVDQFLGIVHRRSEDLGKLIERILLGSRLEAGQEIPIEAQPNDLAGILRRIGSEFADASPKHAITVETAEELWAELDPTAMDQVVGLLVENAIKYSPDGGAIRLGGRLDGPDVLVRISDEGVGIAREDLPHVFEPYFRASHDDGNAFGGVGLGLSIARELVRRHDGRLEVDSIEGRGTTFSIWLPACDPPATASVPELVRER